MKQNKEEKFTFELINSLLRYEPETGKLFWKKRPPQLFSKTGNQGQEGACRAWNTKWAGKECFTWTNENGYKTARFMDAGFKAHRVIWMLCNKEWPKGDVDHINGNKVDNRISNLRVVSREQNNRNAYKPKNNTSGVVGVSWRENIQKWRARVYQNNKEIDLGSYDTFEEAVAVRQAAAQRLGHTARHGEERKEL